MEDEDVTSNSVQIHTYMQIKVVSIFYNIYKVEYNESSLQIVNLRKRVAEDINQKLLSLVSRQIKTSKRENAKQN